MSRPVLMLVVLCLAVTYVGAQDEGPQTEVLFAQDFAKVPLGTPPYPIIDNSGWAGSSVPLTVVDSGDPRHGKILEGRVSGYCQIVLGAMNMQQGHLYRVSLDACSRGGQTITVILRHGPSPYTVYVSSIEKISEEMRHIEFLGRGLKDAEGVNLMLLMNGYTTLGLDNLRIEEVTGELPAGDPPVPGNLLFNAGFELGHDGWFWRGQTATVHDEVFEGRQAAKLTNYAAVSSSWLPLSMQADYRTQVRVKALSPQANVRVYLSDWMFPRGGNVGKSEVYALKREEGWKTVGFTWRPPVPAGKITRAAEVYLTIVCDSPADAAFMVDAAEVKAVLPGTTLDEFQPRAPLEYAITVDAPYNVATEGMSVRATVLASADPQPTALEVHDEQGRPLCSIPLPFTGRQATVTLGKLPSGYWQLITRALKPGARRIEGETFLAVAPRMPDVPLDQWISGTHIPDTPALRTACWRLGLRWDRLHDTAVWTKWPIVEPERDKWVFDDASAQRFRRDGHAILGLLDRVPQWAQASLTEAEEKQRIYLRPDEFGPWEEYCRRTTEHFKGVVDCFEILNEPYGGVSPEEYLKVLQSAHRGVKAGNPSATVVGLGGSGPCDPWLLECLKLGAGKSCDAISFHGYGATIWSTVAGPQRLMDICATIRQGLREAGTPDLPIWDTECGPSVETNFTKYRLLGGDSSALDTARMFPKSVAAANAAGLAHVMYYSGHEKTHSGDGGAGMYLTDLNHTVRMGAIPLAVANAMLTGRHFVRQRTHADMPDLVDLTFEGRGARVRMLWSRGAPLTVSLARTDRALSMWGRDADVEAGLLAVTQEPVYLVQAR